MQHVSVLALLTENPVIAITEGGRSPSHSCFGLRSNDAVGVIPATLVYLGAFYKSNELATRLAWFWGVQHFASATSGIMASGLLKLRGVAGLEGWKWLFLVDGIITVAVALFTWYGTMSSIL